MWGAAGHTRPLSTPLSTVQVPLEPAALAVCTATLLCLPLACVASPLVGLVVWAQTCRTLHRAAHGCEQACSPREHGARTTVHAPLPMHALRVHERHTREQARTWLPTPPLRIQALTELGAGATTRRVNGGALWNVASLVNVLTALFLFLLPTVDQYYVSHQHWLLPFCLLCTKLLLAQSFKLLAASASLTSSGWQLLTSLEEMQASRFNSK